MSAAAEAVGAATAAGSAPDLPGLQPAASYDDRWLLLAVGAVTVVVAYYAAVLWWTRRPRERRRPVDAEPHLARLDEVGSAVRSGRMPAREGHQQVSDIVRRHAAQAHGLPARTMTLADLRREGPADLADLVALVYPPEFSPDDDLARTRFEEALRRARELVSR